ncbi:hypothetical protein LTR53_016918, partial [Teratosphaeriaceae sp. CCFEE 6253]
PDQPPPPRRPHAETFPLARPAIVDLPAPRSATVSSASSPEALSASRSESPAASPQHPPEQRNDPSELFPEAWRPYVPRILDLYLSNMAVILPELDPTQAKEQLRAHFLAFAMTDAAPLHAVMLVASWHYLAMHGAHAHAIDLLHLRGLAIREINRALEDSARRTSDQLVTAVAHMAWYEALCGDRDNLNTHMTGLLRIVSMRGGLPTLGLGGLLERILLWVDANATHIVGTHLYFDKAAFPTAAVHPRPDPKRFARAIA